VKKLEAYGPQVLRVCNGVGWGAHVVVPRKVARQGEKPVLLFYIARLN
jgi:hypothetical protein